jgi:hypothetical protein
MAKVIAVHGIANQFLGEQQIRTHWLPALKDGLTRAGYSLANDEEFTCAFYGDLFRHNDKSKSLGGYFDASDIDEEWEKEMLAAWWEEAAKVDPAVSPPHGKDKSMGMSAVQNALDALRVR